MEFQKVEITITITDLFEAAKLRSGYDVKDLNLALTHTDRGIWDLNLKECADKVYSYLMSAGMYKPGTYQYNVAPPSPGTENLIIYTLYIHANWDPNLRTGLANLIQKALVSGGLYEWYKSTKQLDLAAIYMDEQTTALQEAKQNINRRRFAIERRHITF